MADFACDWCATRGDDTADGVARWLMGALRHTAGATTGADTRHDVARSGRLLRACPTCAPLVRDGDYDGLTDRARAVAEDAGTPPTCSRLEHGLIFRAIGRALITEVADETQRPTAEQRRAWAVASAGVNARALEDLTPASTRHRGSGV